MGGPAGSAAPAYLDRRGEPATLNDMSELIFWFIRSRASAPTGIFKRTGSQRTFVCPSGCGLIHWTPLPRLHSQAAVLFMFRLGRCSNILPEDAWGLFCANASCRLSRS